MIRLAAPDLDENDLAAVCDVLRTGYLVQGRQVLAFEARMVELTGAAHAVAVSNCTAALHLALLALDIGPGDLVAVTSYSWPATANVIALCGAVPVFVDIDPRTFNMEPGALERAMRSSSRIKAVLPVHAFGGIAAMPEIRAIAVRHGVPVLEDAACALGAVLDGRPAGMWGDVGCFSFHPRKIVTTGEGGVIVTQSAEVATRARALRNHGQDPGATKPDFVLPGFNYRLTEFQAALGLAQLGKLPLLLACHRRLARRYDEWFANSAILPPIALEEASHTYQSYVVLLPTSSAEQRDGVIALLKERGIETSIGTYHLPLTTYWRQAQGCKVGDYPVTDDVAARALALPLHTSLSEEDQGRVVEELESSVRQVVSVGVVRG
jgi:dTDP-4-amino-4,6-dideoxygalactose transaminase